ncbi:MAG: hypothetical protein ACT4P6_19340 [Gemmatimonadaceae bacterium]
MRLVLVFVISTLSACLDYPVGGACTDILLPGLRAVVRDSATNAGLAATAVAFARAGTFVDTLRSTGDSVMVGADERAGTYRLEVFHPGYQSWSRDGIHVTRDQCHVKTVRVLVLLVPR